MKKIYLILAVASAVLAANSCDKENVSSTSREPMIVKFTAKAADTKTVFGEAGETSIPVLWEGGENLDVCVNEHASAAVQNNIDVQVPEQGTPSSTATWSYDFSKYYGVGSVTYVPDAPYTFYAFYPGDRMRAFNSSTEQAHGIKIQSLPSEQSPEDNSCDPDAMFLYSISDSYETWPEEVAMPDFKHMTAYGCITLSDIQGNVRKVTVTANKGQYLAGTAYFYYNDNEPQAKKAGEWGNYDFNRKIPAGNPPTETIYINTSKTENIWFGCRPTTELTSLTFGVYTDEGYYEVTKDVTGRNFTAGKVARMTITGFTKKEVVTYTWAASEDSEFILGTVDPSLSTNTGYMWDASTNTATQEFDAGFPSLHWNVQTVLKKKTDLKSTIIHGTRTVGDYTTQRLTIGDKNHAFVDPLTIIISPTADWAVKKVTALLSSGSGVAHFLDVNVGTNLVIDNKPLQNKSIEPSATTYESTEFTPVSDEVILTVTNKDSRGAAVDNVIYLYSISLDLVYNPTPQSTPSE